MSIPTVYRSNILYLVICMLGMLAFGMVGIFPNLSNLKQMDKEIAELNDKVQIQEILYPVYMELIKQSQLKMPTELPLPTEEKISNQNIAEINHYFSEVAKQSGVTFESGVPDPKSYLNESNQLIMNVSFNGDFFNFRDLLIKISKMPFLNAIDYIQIKTEGNSKRMLVKLSLRQK